MSDGARHVYVVVVGTDYGVERIDDVVGVHETRAGAVAEIEGQTFHRMRSSVDGHEWWSLAGISCARCAEAVGTAHPATDDGRHWWIPGDDSRWWIVEDELRP